MIDSRDQLWEATFDTYYDVYYAELISDALLRKLQWVDDINKALVAVTASGSAIAGWTIWDKEYGRIIWGIFAGLAAVLSIIHAAMRVPERLKGIGEIQGTVSALRADIETYRYLMKINPDFPLEEFTKRFEEYRKRFASSVKINDNLLTNRLRRKVQRHLDSRLKEKDETVE